jgi:oxygen-independent coproporphyrinogen-3 oxidase
MTTGSIYIHIPFCAKKCPYCHFFVQPLQDVSLYLAGIKKEWESKKNTFKEVISIYLGGGTPSLLSLSEVAEIVELFKEFSPTEITIEANPDDVTLEKMKGYLSLGINRLSIGVQSLDDSSLKTIDRMHSAKKAIDAIEIAHAAGFDNISIDLMYDLPHQTFSSWKKTVDRAMLLPISHLSIYNLIFEEGSLYYKKQKELSPHTPNEEESLKMLEYAVQTCEKSGLHRYEISAFCRNEKQSLHNIGYWKGRPFIGLGPSAFSYINGSRFKNISHLKKWDSALEAHTESCDFTETLPYPDNVHELLAIRLRLMEGASLADFPSLPPETITTLVSLTNQNLLIFKENRYRLTERGKLFYDLVASELV